MPGLSVRVEDSKSLVLAVSVAAIALILLVVQELAGSWRSGTDPLADPGRRMRRRSGSLLMLGTGLTMAAGSMVKPMLAGKPNLTYLLVWLLVLFEVAGLLVLAWRDLGSTRRLAKSIREQLHRDSLAQIDAAIQQRRERLDVDPEASNGHLH